MAIFLLGHPKCLQNYLNHWGLGPLGGDRVQSLYELFLILESYLALSTAHGQQNDSYH